MILAAAIIVVSIIVLGTVLSSLFRIAGEG
jgi:hypothetical protein